MTPVPTHIVEALREVFRDALFVYVHGSAASGRLTEESDLDVAVMFERNLSLDERGSLAETLERRVGRKVDLLDLRTADPIIKMQVLSKGQAVVVEDRRALAEFRMYTPSLYFDAKIQRRPAEQALFSWAREVVAKYQGLTQP